MARLARSRQQQDMLAGLEEGLCIQSPAHGLRGRSKDYKARYEASFRNFIERLRQNGYRLMMLPGPRGGWGSAHWALVGATNLCERCEKKLPEVVADRLQGR